MKKKHGYFLIKQKEKIKQQESCLHDKYFIKCSCCGKILGSEIQDNRTMEKKTMASIQLVHKVEG